MQQLQFSHIYILLSLISVAELRIKLKNTKVVFVIGMCSFVSILGMCFQYILLTSLLQCYFI